MILRSLLLPALCLAWVGCSVKDPPRGADIAPESAREKIAPRWSASHTRGAVVPGWIRSFGDGRSTVLALGGELITLASVDAATMTLERRPDLRVAGTDSVRWPVRLESSHDRRCIALLDAADRWLAAARPRE